MPSIVWKTFINYGKNHFCLLINGQYILAFLDKACFFITLMHYRLFLIKKHLGYDYLN